MKTNRLFKFFILVLLIAALAVSMLGCFGGQTTTEKQDPVTFTFEVYLKDGTLKSTREITTTEATVGAALLKEGLISGDNGQFGLYVKVVDGVTADYDVDGTYWAFYVGDTYAMTGVDSTTAEDGKTYSFRIE